MTLSAGIPERSELRLSLIRDVPLLPVEQAITEIAPICVKQNVMPADPTSDALHLAIASFHKCDFLVTWNCRHIANPAFRPRIESVLNDASLRPPVICTPQEMLNV